MSDLGERLRVRHECTAGYTRDIYAPSDQDLDLEAADEIYLLSAALKAVKADRDRLRSELDEARSYAHIYEVGMEDWKSGAMRYREALDALIRAALASTPRGTLLQEAIERARAALAGERKADHQHTNECWEPDSGCDMGRNEKYATVDRQSPTLSAAICGHCGADRLKEACSKQQCQWIATAYQEPAK